ncbi:hypothetical protein [Helicobacter pylori]|uniref:hypothetical protein n=1 Tax=Helicobacter pylori TaxID=210 RepID=UPI000992B9AB|nr:hypothetical protein [Helicobacter pylori]OOQ00360.1 hypothetical protein B0X50_05900 [Helicobacter pylori]OOQ21943.1 hypothetical protein B0X63_00885 [Helicobacter pylori]OOQ31782.1 hypothetical protein B0X66_06855 [Helicobacter pylori]PDW19497.1 hypothetical protein BB436_03425 [Helicobacter pylori]PDX06009.1 hypothetical protein BB404_07900 [Helicobacter pylori]
MPNTTTQKDFSQLSKRQIFNLILSTEEKIKKIQKEKVSLKENLTKELEKKLEKSDKSFTSKLEKLNKVLQELNAVFDQKRLNDCCFGHETPNIQTQQAMRDVGNKETDLIVEDFSSYSDERKRALGVETQP